jgi:hypothetical protein
LNFDYWHHVHVLNLDCCHRVCVLQPWFPSSCLCAWNLITVMISMWLNLDCYHHICELEPWLLRSCSCAWHTIPTSFLPWCPHVWHSALHSFVHPFIYIP